MPCVACHPLAFILPKFLAAKSQVMHAQLMTTQAIDIIQGGMKINALPERVVTSVNHRIAVDSSLLTTQQHYEDVLLGVAKANRLNFTLMGFTNRSSVVLENGFADAVGKVTILPRIFGIEPAPVSPSHDASEKGWAVLEGTIHHVFDDLSETGSVVVVPSLPSGNTDMKQAWRLSRNIYRFGLGFGGHAHTVDEFAYLSAFLGSISFFHELIRNWDLPFDG
ncbi:hypothetical protein HDU98_004398 [Podochytrium sp. JEL0797]|nr:hypothetical protein HDU98_004398 [Podochytrium sp. JEL0797]